MCKVSMILAVGPNNIIGIGDKMAWHSKKDFEHFKRLTLGKPCIFGSNTFFGLPSYPLKNRLNMVVDLNYKETTVHEGYIAFQAIEDAIRAVSNFEEVMICGGASVYKYCLEKGLIDGIYLTTIVSEKLSETLKNEEQYVKLPFDIHNVLKTGWKATELQKDIPNYHVIENDMTIYFDKWIKV